MSASATRQLRFSVQLQPRLFMGLPGWGQLNRALGGAALTPHLIRHQTDLDRMSVGSHGPLQSGWKGQLSWVF